MNILIVDTETTGLSPDQGAECIEVGAILYNVEHRAILAQVSTVLPVEKIGQEEVHGISLATARSLPLNIGVHAAQLINLFEDNADYVVAHNASFDKQFLNNDKKLWLCTYEDFNFAPHKPQNLVSLALAHGIAVKSAHRALNDCGLIAEIFTARPDLEALIEAAIARSKSPQVWVRALVDYPDRHLASKARFEWKSKTKEWVKLIKECDLKTLNFAWELIK